MTSIRSTLAQRGRARLPSLARAGACLALVASLGAGLSACVPLVVGGAAMGGLVALDRRTSGTQLEDQTIEMRSSARITDTFANSVHVNVTSFNRQVLLTGEVPSEQVKQRVEQIVASVQNVQRIVNELAAMDGSTVSQRANDALITGKVKTRLVDSTDIFGSAFKVTTERSVVYLQGIVSQREADRATEIARSTTDVQRVVRILDIVSEAEAQRLSMQRRNEQSTPATAAPANP